MPLSPSQKQSVAQQPLIPLEIRLWLLVGGVGLCAGAFLLWPPAPEPAAPSPGPEPVSDSLQYDELLPNQVVEAGELALPRAVGALYLWTGQSLSQGPELEQVKTTLLSGGAEKVTQLTAGRGRFHLRAGPFASASDRNNMRQEMVKRGIALFTASPAEFAP